MADVIPFKALRPTRDKVHLVATRPYYTYKKNVLNAKLEDNPFTFLHIINPEFKHPEISPERAEIDIIPGLTVVLPLAIANRRGREVAAQLGAGMNDSGREDEGFETLRRDGENEAGPAAAPREQAEEICREATDEAGPPSLRSK